jgi:ubiquinol-cytochrome c reductase cytochrome c subunit
VIHFLLAAALSAPPKMNDGEALFRTRCSSCHGLNLQGGPQAPPLVDVDAGYVDFMLRTGRMPAEAPGSQEFTKPPDFTHEQMRSLVAYVMSRSSGEKALPVFHLNGDVQRGRAVYAENCAQCHSATGHGNNVGYRNEAPAIMHDTPLEIAEAVREGPDVMPKFGPRVLDQQQLDDVIAYVGWLQKGNYNPGGLSLSNWGPISEGFVAWAFGAALLMFLCRRIGTTE